MEKTTKPKRVWETVDLTMIISEYSVSHYGETPVCFLNYSFTPSSLRDEIQKLTAKCGYQRPYEYSSDMFDVLVEPDPQLVIELEMLWPNPVLAKYNIAE